VSQHEAFLHAIIEAPDDDSPRLVYADWLEDNGDPARAEFIRVQCRLAALDEDDPERLALQAREYDLLADHWGAWAAPLIGRVRRWQFRRGFVEQIKAEPGQFLKEAKRLLDFAPIRELNIKYPTADEVRALAASKHLRRIVQLNLDHAKLGDAGAAVLADSPNLGGLTHLSLRFTDLETTGLCTLASSPRLRGLRALDATANDVKRGAFEAFIAACRLPQLERLAWDRHLGPDGIGALLASPLARQLIALRLREVHLGAEGLRRLLESPALTRLGELWMQWGEDFSAIDLVDLASSPVLRNLRSLELIAVGVGDRGATELARLSAGGALRNLDLPFNKIGEGGAAALVNAPLAAGLTRLNLSGNPIGAGLNAVATSPRLGNLRRLDVAQCGITRPGALALLRSPHLDRLVSLRLDENPIGPKAFKDLKARLGDRLFHEWYTRLTPAEIVRRVKEQPPRCLRGLGARPDTALIRRFPRDFPDRRDYPFVSFELTHPDPAQKAVLLGYPDTRGFDIHFSPYAIRWEPSGEQREFLDAEQHGRSAENDDNCTITGEGKRKPWTCGQRGCRDHAFIATFAYRLEYPPQRYIGRHLPFADQFYHFYLQAYCATQDRMIEVADFECK
jgi:uncharacterized protein (TIGR02996 family)